MADSDIVGDARDTRPLIVIKRLRWAPKEYALLIRTSAESGIADVAGVAGPLTTAEERRQALEGALPFDTARVGWARRQAWRPPRLSARVTLVGEE